MTPTHFLHNPTRKSIAMCYQQPDGRTLVVWTKHRVNPDPNPPGKLVNRTPYFTTTEVVTATFTFTPAEFVDELAKHGVTEDAYGSAWTRYSRD